MNSAVSLDLESDKRTNTQKEWLSVKCPSKESSEIYVPLLIMEIHRLQPFCDSVLPRFHVLHRPGLKVFHGEIIGIIRRIFLRNVIDLYVDDGTGRIQVIFKFKDFDKLKEERRNIDAKYQRLEKIAKIKNCDADYMKDLEKRWLQETNNGSLGSHFKVLEYVQVFGFLQPDFGCSPRKDMTLENGHICKPTVIARTINRITEKEYNDKMQTFLSKHIKNRYQTS